MIEKKNWKQLTFNFAIEGILIVASILFALFIDNYKESREERKMERYYLQNLKNDLIADTSRYAGRREDLKTVMTYCDSIVSVKSGKARMNKNLVDKFDYLFMSIVGIDFEHDPTFESMKYSSHLGVIGNLPLQGSIVSYYSYGEFVNRIANDELHRLTQARRDARNSSGLLLDFKITESEATELLKKSEVYNLTFDSLQTINFVVEILDTRIKDSKMLITAIDRYLSERQG